MEVQRLLTLWSGGWVVRDHQPAIDAHDGRVIAAYLDVGAQQDESEAERQADATLREFAYPRLQLSGDYDPPDGETLPWRSFSVADTVTFEGDPIEVVSLRFGRSSVGVPVYQPKFGAVLLSEQQRVARNLKKMAPGSGRGQFRIATPMTPVPTAGAASSDDAGGSGGAPFVVFDRKASDSDYESKFWTYTGEDTTATLLVADLLTGNTTTIDLLLNGSVVDSLTCDGDPTERTDIDVDIVDGDQLFIGCADVGFELVVSVWFG